MKKILTKKFITKIWLGQILFYLIVNGGLLVSLGVNQLLYPTCDVWATEKILTILTPSILGQTAMLLIAFAVQFEKVYSLSKYEWYSKLNEWDAMFTEKYPVFTKWFNKLFTWFMIIIFVIILLIIIFQNPCQ